jgi:predicted GNAT superfamily acetyltransferase
METEIRDLKTLEEFQQCVEMQKEVWGFDDPFDAVPLPLLVVSERNDGIVMGAFDGPRMVGFVYSLPGFHEGKKVQWSHMLAVTSSYRNSDIGYQLKMAQYRRSQECGYDVIEWTYDPLESRNAHFNLKKLGCVAKEYEINVYGETSSPLHQGSPTDRFIAHWVIPPLQKSLPEWKEIPEDSVITETKHYPDGAVEIRGTHLDLQNEFLFVEIPADMQTLKSHAKDAALQWRLKTREIFLHYFGKGYVAYSFIYMRESRRSYYVLKLSAHGSTRI